MLGSLILFAQSCANRINDTALKHETVIEENTGTLEKENTRDKTMEYAQEYTRITSEDSLEPTAMYPVLFLEGNLQRWGLIDSNGKLITTLKYTYCSGGKDYSCVCIDKEDSNEPYYDIFGDRIELESSYSIHTFVNLHGEEVLGYFASATEFSEEGLAIVKDAKGRFHTMNKNGEIISTLEDSRIMNINTLHEGMAKFTTHDYHYGYVNDRLEIVIEPIYTFAQDFSEEFALVTDVEYDSEHNLLFDGKKSGFIDKNGDMVIEIPNEFARQWYEYHAYPDPMYETSSFSDGLARIYIPGEEFPNENGEYITPEFYYIDKTGQIKLHGVESGIFTYGLAPARESQSGLYGFIDKNGEFVIEPQFDYAYSFNESGLALVFKHIEDDEYQSINDRKLGYINPKGEYIIPPIYHSTRLFPTDLMENGIVCLLDEDSVTWYYIRIDGTILGKMQMK